MKKQLDITVEVKRLTEEEIRAIMQNQLNKKDEIISTEDAKEDTQCCQEN
ncbi:MAG: hypothetical protein RBS92_08460 [Candidatus Cloacimonadales bacterium]|jgi:hypothetical protein|nr:hypothetical protein [Candidatus Cloacimonadales bacterium]